MKKSVAILIYLLLFIAYPCLAQGEASNWYFGANAGLNFSTTPPTPLLDGELNTLEGCATISDSFGNLLFYTNGTDVWNRDHQIMPNGTGLLGEDTSTQSAIIVPNPQNTNVYYIFTVDGLFPGENDPALLRGLNYSAVDLTLDGGLGDVVVLEKNINLLPTNSEKITAVRNDDCESIWVITHFNDRFYAYDVTGAGVNLTPIESIVTPDAPITGYRDNALGYLKSSPNGKKLAIAHATLNENPLSDAYSPGKFLVYDFDPATGIVSGGTDLNVNDNSPYGVAFSPNSKLVYTTVSVYIDNSFDHGEVYQYNISASDPSATLTVLSSNDTSSGALQLGIDGKIYRAILNHTTLDVINDPNNTGAGANYEFAAVPLGGRFATFGLPPFIQSLFLNTIDIIQNGVSTTHLNLCIGQDYLLVAQNISGATYTWTHDGVLLAESDFELLISEPGLYRVEIDPMNGDCPIIGQAIVVFSPLPEAFDATLVQCGFESDSSDITIFNLTEANADLTGGDTTLVTSFYTTLTNAEDDIAELNPISYTNISNPETLYVRVTNEEGCFSISELTLLVSVIATNSAELAFCDDSIEDGILSFTLSEATPQVLDGLPADLDVVYYETGFDALLEENALGATYTNTTPFSQIIFARIENDNECVAISEVRLLVYKLPNIEVEETYIYCTNSFPETITIDSGFIIGDDSPIEIYSFLWSTGEISPEIQINEIGTYTVDITSPEGCTKRRTVTVAPSNPAIIDEIITTDIVENNTVTVLVSGDGDYEFALDNIFGPYQDSNLFENVSPGIHTVYVRDKNDCGITQQIISIIGFPNYFTPNGDGYHDFWQVRGINSNFQPTTKIYIFDRFGKLLKVVDPLGIGWDGTYRGNPLPSSDYWFRAILEDGREVRSHFSLIR